MGEQSPAHVLSFFVTVINNSLSAVHWPSLSFPLWDGWNIAIPQKNNGLFFAIVWIGSAIGMNVLRHAVTTNGAEEMYMLSIYIKILDDTLIWSGVTGWLITGIVYGVCSKWGFFKQRWIIVKWIFTAIMRSGSARKCPADWMVFYAYNRICIQSIVKYHLGRFTSHYTYVCYFSPYSNQLRRKQNKSGIYNRRVDLIIVKLLGRNFAKFFCRQYLEYSKIYCHLFLYKSDY